MAKPVKKKIGELLIDVGMITKEQLDECLEIQKTKPGKIGEILVGKGYVTQWQVVQALEFQLGIPHVDLEKFAIETSAVVLVPEGVARRYILIPIKCENDILTVAMNDPLDLYALDDVRIYSGKKVQPVISIASEIEKAIGKYYSGRTALQAVEEYKREQKEKMKVEEEDESDLINNAPAVKLFNSIVEQAIRSRASDIHIEPFEQYLRVRLRVDGELQEVMRPSVEILKALVARIKIVGNMNIAEKRVPQDGRITTEVDKKGYDLRVSILPTIYGEKIVIRIIDKGALVVSKKHLGLDEKEAKSFDDMFKNPHGIILVTGPTGSGKTTTLYSAISGLNKPGVNIVTIEDPVEAKIDGINQVNVNNKAGMTFATGLRSMLRQDPDIILIGEIRDTETAQIAIKAAITGHLVISTLHTNSAPGAIARLMDMGIEPFMVSTALVGVIAQRLVKKVCSSCKEEYEADEKEKTLLGIDQNEKLILYKGKGCNYCNKSGYKGRVGVYEMMNINKELRILINKGATEEEIRDEAIRKGMRLLKDSAKKLVLEGKTTFKEYLRISHSGDDI